MRIDEKICRDKLFEVLGALCRVEDTTAEKPLPPDFRHLLEELERAERRATVPREARGEKTD